MQWKVSQWRIFITTRTDEWHWFPGFGVWLRPPIFFYQPILYDTFSVPLDDAELVNWPPGPMKMLIHLFLPGCVRLQGSRGNGEFHRSLTNTNQFQAHPTKERPLHSCTTSAWAWVHHWLVIVSVELTGQENLATVLEQEVLRKNTP